MSAQADHCPLCGTPTSALRPWLTMPIDAKKRARIDTGTLVWCDTCELGTTLCQPDDQALLAAYDLSAYYTSSTSHMPDVRPGLVDKLLL